MKRDWDLIRDVLIEVEGLSENEKHGFSYVCEPNADPVASAKFDNAWLLHQAGFLKGSATSFLDGKRIILAPSLTWEGHDLLSTIRSKPVWERVKAVAKEKGIDLTVDAVKALGKMALDWVLAT